MPPPVQPPRPATGGTPVVFSRPDAERIAATVAFVETSTRHRRARDRNFPTMPAVVLRKAMTGGGGIAAASSQTNPGSGTVTLYKWNGSSWATTGQTVTARNPSTAGAVAGSTLVTIGFIDGIWEVILEPCP